MLFLCFLSMSSIPVNFLNKKKQKMKDLNSFGNFSNDWIFGEFPKNLGIWEISQIPRHLGNFRNFPNPCWNLMVVHFNYLKISEMPGLLGNFLNARVFGKLLLLTFLIIAVTSSDFHIQVV